MALTRRQTFGASIGVMAGGSIAGSWAQTGGGARPKLKLGIITDLAGPYADLNRPSMACAQQALEDFDVAGRGWDVEILLGQHFDKADKFKVDVPLESAEADDFDALLLPGGVANPDQLRANPRAVAFVRAFYDAGKPIAAICHGPWTLIDAGIVAGRRMTSWPSLRTDLTNAGADWVDQEVVVEKDLVSSRKPQDIPAFNREMIALFDKAGVANPS